MPMEESDSQHDQKSKPYSPFLTQRFDRALQVASGLHHRDSASHCGSEDAR